MQKLNLLLIGCLSFLTASQVYAFPEMVKKDYPNCMSCHRSPSGGGILTPYGRELSKELLSRWGQEGESAFAYGVFKPPEFLSFGGDIRFLQDYKNNQLIRKADFFFMQIDLETAVQYQALSAIGTIGLDLEDKSLISRRHYFLYHLNDIFCLRAGRFLPAFGINTPDHIITTKRGIGFDQATETYNVEVSWVGERINIYATGIFGRPDSPSLIRETGGALNTSIFMLEKHKIGVSYYFGFTETTQRHLFGPYGIFRFTPKLVWLTELDFQAKVLKSLFNQVGVVNYQRLDYEISQGLHPYLIQSLSKEDFANPLSLFESYGIGVQFFPRPHWVLQLEFLKQRTLSFSRAFSDFAWLLVHFYP